MVTSRYPLRVSIQNLTAAGRTTTMSQTTSTWTVVGMTCGHCVSSVSEEVGALAGVERVEVDLETGRLTLTSVGVVDEADVRAAVEEAGYELAGAS
jgi:copper chaperone CopZ